MAGCFFCFGLVNQISHSSCTAVTFCHLPQLTKGCSQMWIGWITRGRGWFTGNVFKYWALPGRDIASYFFLPGLVQICAFPVFPDSLFWNPRECRSSARHSPWSTNCTMYIIILLDMINLLCAHGWQPGRHLYQPSRKYLSFLQSLRAIWRNRSQSTSWHKSGKII